MIAADTSTWISFLQNKSIDTIEKLQSSLRDGALVMPPPVLMELLSFPQIRAEDRHFFEVLPQLEILEGFWERAGELRNGLLKKKQKCRSMDCLIAQSCIDHDVPLLADDQDFRHFSKFGLSLV